MTFFRRWFWSIQTAKEKILALERVYDVMIEEPSEDRHLVHVWLTDLNPQIEQYVAEAIRQQFRGRPRHIKIDVLLYRREAV